MNVKNWLNNVRLGAKNDRALVIVGGQGSGKTTAARVISKLIAGESRSVFVAPTDFEKKFFLHSVYQRSLVVIECESEPVAKDWFAVVKPLISNHTVAVERMNKSTINVDHDMNFILLVTGDFEPSENDRRVLVTTPLAAINEALGVL